MNGIVIAAALVGGLSGLLVAPVITRLPEPTDDPVPVGAEADDTAGSGHSGVPEPIRRPRKAVPDFSLWGMQSIEGAKEPYVDMARARGLMPGSVLAGALLGAFLGWRLGLDPALALWLPLVPILIAIAVVDWRSRLIPTRLVLPATGFVVLTGVVVAAATADRGDLVRGLIALTMVRSFFWVLWFMRSAGMGFGDVRLAALLGFALGFVGPIEALLGAYAGFVVFALPGVLLALVRWNYRLMRIPFPFGPFMILGALVGLAFGHDIGSALVG